MKNVVFCLSLLTASTVSSFAETKAEDKSILNREDKTILNGDVIKGNWHILKGKVMQKWAKITNDDILKMKGTREELRGELEKKYGYKKEEAEREIDSFLKEHTNKK